MKPQFPFIVPHFLVIKFLSVTTEETKSILERERELLFPLTDSQLFCCMKRMESDEYPVYRLCILTFPILFEIADYESKWAGGQIRKEFPKFQGAWSYFVENTLSRIFETLNANISVIVESEMGTKKKNGTLTGCFRSIRDNESDISMIIHDYPTIDYDKVDPYQIITEEPLKIVSAYHSKTEADVSFNDFILTSIKSFDSQTWFAVLSMVLAFFGLWMMKRTLFLDNEYVSLRKRIADTLWDTLLFFISQESTDYYKFMDRLLSILMTLSFFLLTNIYFGLMSTDLVTVTKPTVINSYQDIMNRPNITPIFHAMMNDYKEFEDAYEDNEDSIQAKFWAKYKDKLETLGPYSDPARGVNVLAEVANLNGVLIMHGVVADAVRRMICELKVGCRLYENSYTWISRDPDTRMQKKVLIMRNGMKQTRYLKTLRRKLRSVLESGILSNQIDVASKNGLPPIIPRGPHSQVERCISDEIIYAHASVDTVVIENFRVLLVLLAVMLPASIIVLLIELYCCRNVQVAI